MAKDHIDRWTKREIDNIYRQIRLGRSDRARTVSVARARRDWLHRLACLDVDRSLADEGVDRQLPIRGARA